MNRMMAKWLATAAVCAVVAAVSTGCGKDKGKVVVPNAEDNDQVVIWVGEKGVTQGQLRGEIGRLEKGLPPGLQGDELRVVRMQLLDRAIENIVMRTVVKMAYDRSGMVISREEVEKAKKDLFGANQSEEALAIMLAENNMTIPQLEDNLRLDIFRNRTLKDKIDAARDSVTEETAKAYYDEHLEQEFTRPEGRLVSHILVRVARDATDETKAAARKKAEDVKTALREGADFETLAKEVSDCPSAQRGGLLGLIPKGRNAGAFDETVFSQEVGEIGEVVESPIGYHVIKVMEEVSQEVYPFEDLKDRLTAMLKTRAQREVGKSYVEQLKEEFGVRFDGPLAALNQPLAGEEAGEEAEQGAAAEGAEEGGETEGEGESGGQD